MSRDIECKSCRGVDDYLVDRVQHKIREYSKKALRYRFWHQVMATSGALGAVALPALINLGMSKTVLTIISLFVAAIVAMEGLFHFREHWRTYDMMRAKLREEEMRFSVEYGCATASAGDPAAARKAFLDFVDRIEDAIAKERAETIAMRTAQSDATRGAPGKNGDAAVVAQQIVLPQVPAVQPFSVASPSTGSPHPGR